MTPKIHLILGAAVITSVLVYYKEINSQDNYLKNQDQTTGINQSVESKVLPKCALLALEEIMEDELEAEGTENESIEYYTTPRKHCIRVTRDFFPYLIKCLRNPIKSCVFTDLTGKEISDSLALQLCITGIESNEDEFMYIDYKCE